MNPKTTALALFILIAAAHTANAEIRIDSISMDPSYIEAGDTVDVYVKFHNAPDRGQAIKAAYYSVRAASDRNLLGDDPDTAYWVELAPGDDLAQENLLLIERKKRVGRMFPGESWTTPFKIKVKNEAPPATYKLDITLTKTDLAGTEGELAVAADTLLTVKGEPRFDLEAPQNSLPLGGEDKIRVTVTNVGGAAARHVTLGLNLTVPFTPLDAAVTDAGTIPAGGQKTLAFPVSVSTDAEAKAYPVVVGLSYIGENGTTLQASYPIGVEVTGEPKIDVALDDTGSLSPGKSGDIVVSIVNEDYVDAKFLSIELSPGKGYTLRSTSQIYVGAVDSDDFETVDYTLKIDSGVTSESVPLSFTVTYKKAGSNRDYTRQYAVDLPLVSEAQLREDVGAADASQYATYALLAIPGFVVVYLALWLLVKILGAVTRFLDRRIFNRQKK